MEAYEILEQISTFHWSTLNRIYGCAHSSIIGFISYEWLSNSKQNSILDGAPSPLIGEGRKGQLNCDLLLCQNQNPVVPVEVETSVSKHSSKLNSIYIYMQNFKSIQFGLLYLTNLTSGVLKYQHNWENLKREILESENNYSIVLISSKKERIKFLIDSDWAKLLRRNDYSPWEIICIDYWIYDSRKTIKEGNLWHK